MLIFSLFSAFSQAESIPENMQEEFLKLKNAALVIGNNNEVYFKYNADKNMVPASTMKILIAYAALEKWGREHRFTTNFYLNPNDKLCVKGSGDPFITSDELLMAAINLSSKSLPKLNGIVLDTRFFGDDISVDGRTSTFNPYDAPLSAIAVNFNTLSIKKKAGVVESGEDQTPLTPVAKMLGEKVGNGFHRINVQNKFNGERQFAELLYAFLESTGQAIDYKLVNGECDTSKPPVYQHKNSHTLEEQVRGMLKYSNNFIANQLFLLLGANEQATTPRAQKNLQYYTTKLFGWKQGKIVDGAGLSRNNVFTANEMIVLLETFRPYADLLNCYNDDSICAKTGTLKGVQTFAGYINHRGQKVPFALFINEYTKRGFRLDLMQDWASAMEQLEPITIARTADNAIIPPSMQ